MMNFVKVAQSAGIVPILSFGDFGTGKYSTSGEAASRVFWNFLWVTKGTFQFLCKSQFFPMNGLAGVVKKNSSTSGEAASGGIFFYHNC